MPTIRERVDEDTGRIIKVQIDTTKEAKKRRKTAVAQWVPTTGEINAADLWNKQEEKIKRDKEREERKKKTAARQAEKDAKAKELQDELLRKGKISVEDTWGKVSASQNRLSKFFGPPSALKQPTKQSTEFVQNNEAQETDMVITVGDTVLEDRSDDRILVNDSVAAFMTGSQIRQRSPIQVHGRWSGGSTGGESGRHLMLPPPAPQRSPYQVSNASSQGGTDAITFTSIRTSKEKLSPPARRALSQLTANQLNVRFAGHSILQSGSNTKSLDKPTQSAPLSTQVMMETLDGISSQDLIDDFSEDAASDKENLQPEYIPNESSPCNTTTETFVNKADSHLPASLSASVSFGEFGDDRIDDETLLYFAATQRINSNVQPLPVEDISHKSPKLSRALSLNAHEDGSYLKLNRSPVNSTKQQAAGDSFAFTDIDDEDLVKCLEEFEDDTDELDDEDLLQAVENFEATNGQGQQGRPQKKRRVLPWVKHPVQYSSQESVNEPFSATQSFKDC